MRFFFLLFGVARGARLLDDCLFLLEAFLIGEGVLFEGVLVVVAVWIRRKVPYSKTLRWCGFTCFDMKFKYVFLN